MTNHFMGMALEVNTLKSDMYLDKWRVKLILQNVYCYMYLVRYQASHAKDTEWVTSHEIFLSNSECI